MKYLQLFRLFFIVQSIAEDQRSFRITKKIGWKLQCDNTTCLPDFVVMVSNIRACQVICLNDIFCKAVSFHQITLNCQMFRNVPNSNGNLIPDSNIITMVVIDGTRIPPEPTTTSSTSTTTSSSSSTTISSTTTTTSVTTKTTSTSSTTTTTTSTTTTCLKCGNQTSCCDTECLDGECCNYFPCLCTDGRPCCYGCNWNNYCY